GRAIKTNFLSETGKFNITKCYRCMPSCNPKDIPYCISEGLINSVQGRDGLIFSGADLSNVNKMTTVKEVIDKLIR
ncbi:MAG: nitronate monooxygenase, partial [Sedimentibacter sp.]